MSRAALRRRLAALEARTTVRAPCPSCGCVPGEPVTGYAVFAFEDERGQDLGPDVCPECGRVLVFRIVFGYGDETDEEGS